KQTTVCLGGTPFGLRMYSGELKVVGFDEIDCDGDNKSPAYSAGIRENDTIVSIDSKEIKTAKDITDACERSGGGEITVECRRDGQMLTFRFRPAYSKSEERFKTGMWIKDSTAGIGTVTYTVPGTRGFAGLGHSVLNSGTGELVKVGKGDVASVTVTGVNKGKEGEPGELVGAISDEKTGTLIANTNEGVYGFFSGSNDAETEGKMIEMASPGEGREGDAFIRCTADKDGPENYGVKILHVDYGEETNKNFIIEITDPKLIEKSGGIVQGMSGSPIIQNGKLIGAVTHVFISDPLKGYGIAIGKMYENMPGVLK
ncbi:MAG: PDZ domain-containing protein, partial [Clostridia bacterium]|nr:PDZ domain-containing protein [Clostridia bacterium]